MAVSEPDRLDLYRGLEEALGKRRAETFMRMVSTVPWTEVATKSDLAELRAAAKGDLAELRAATKGDLAELRAEMHRALRLQFLSIVTVMAMFNGMTFAALRFF